jgi:nicotinamidase-related amidase
MSLRSDVALLLIDVQQGLDEPRWGTRNNPDAEQRIADLLAAWRAAKRPVIHVQHLSTEPDSPLRPDRPGHVFKVEATPIDGEPVFRKNVNSAFIGTDLETHLRDRGIDSLVIAGITTDHCVSSTTRMAGNLGFTVTVVEDATATFDRVGPDGAHYSADIMHRAALASLHGEFATVRSTQDVLAEAELESQTKRIGIDWTVVAERLLTRNPELLPEAPLSEADPAVGSAAIDMLPLLRTLPDGAGTDAFIDALDGK